MFKRICATVASSMSYMFSTTIGFSTLREASARVATGVDDTDTVGDADSGEGGRIRGFCDKGKGKGGGAGGIS